MKKAMNVSPWKNRIPIFTLIIFLSFCAPGKKVDITAKIDDYQIRITGAEDLFRMGSYSALKEAFTIYQDLLAFPFQKVQTEEKLLRTALLLTLREKELAILNETYLKKAEELVEKLSALSKYKPFVEMVTSVSVRSKGVLKDIVEDSIKRRQILKKLQDSKQWMAKLKEEAESDEFYSYLYLSIQCPLYHVRADVKEDFNRILEIFSKSPSIKFKYAFCTGRNLDLFEEVIAEHPEFFEVYYFLGENALKQGRLITAERNFLKCYEEIPESTNVVTSLANVHFALEELEKSLEFFEKAITLAPEYRDALLGKAVCLSYLGKYQEAIQECEKLISLGKWYLGEAHYWLAWNQHELVELESSVENIEKAKYYLPTSGEVFTLSGILAFKKRALRKAEQDLKKGADLDATNCEPLFYLGRVYNKLQDWAYSALYFERAASCHEFNEKAIRNKIEELKSSSLQEGRRARLIRRKESQLKRVLLTKGTAYYNAAAGHFNSGRKEKALTLAEKASFFPSLKQKAEKLISRIKSIK